MYLSVCWDIGKKVDINMSQFPATPMVAQGAPAITCTFLLEETTVPVKPKQVIWVPG